MLVNVPNGTLYSKSELHSLKNDIQLIKFMVGNWNHQFSMMRNGSNMYGFDGVCSISFLYTMLQHYKWDKSYIFDEMVSYNNVGQNILDTCQYMLKKGYNNKILNI